MCKCTPGIKTAFCGKPGCEWPPQSGMAPSTSDNSVMVPCLSWQNCRRNQFCPIGV
jgi:hypothetical protein